MDTTVQIKEIIRNNSNNIAFIIGNGINLQFYKNNIFSWDKMLEELSNTYLKDAPDSIKDFSLTELYDLIELEAIKGNGLIGRNVDFSKNEIIAYKKTLQSNNLDFNRILHIANNSTTENNAVLSSSKSKELDRYKNVYLEYIKGCRKWCERNREDSKSLSDEQCVERFMDYASNPSKILVLKNTVKQSVVKMYSKKLDNPNFTLCTSFFKNIDAPTLTTNFDTIIAQSLHLSKRRMGKSFTAFYPWNVYYSDKELDCPISGFGIWHINGVVEYPQSIKLGISDYMGNVERVRKMLHSHDFNEFFNGKNQNNWVGYYTWLHIFFNRDLFIFGLKLESNEVFLRWLLIQRAKYSQMYNKTLKGWFVDKDIDENKKYFLNKVGFDVIDISDFNELYDSFLMA